MHDQALATEATAPFASPGGALVRGECGFSSAAGFALEQRKPLTVLSCDLTGSTALGETLIRVVADPATTGAS